MNDIRTTLQRGLLVLLMSGATLANAAVPADEAAKLKTELTPLGGERAGNKDGTIPPWDGGYTTARSNKRADPFKDDKPVLTITAKNAAQHEARLTDGIKAMLKKYPETFRLDVYKTRRTAAAPQFVYDNTLRNATRAKLANGIPEGAFAGIPFPIPKNGEEVMWNHLLRWRGTAVEYFPTTYQVTSDAKTVLVSDLVVAEQFPYYFQESSLEAFARTNDYYLTHVQTTAPSLRAGELIAGRLNLDSTKDQAWVYLTGQRRVRKLPNPCCDTPAPTLAGLMSFDEIFIYSGRMDRFDWKLVGKQEMYVPYNGNRFFSAKADSDVLMGQHANPEYLRWELHRVWVVEATVRAGQRHQAARSRYYCDEDSWTCVLADRWDAKGQLWKVIWGNPVLVPEMPGMLTPVFGFNDMLSGAAAVTGINTKPAAPIELKSRWPESRFSGDALAAEGVR